jgi:hypothetical protein
MRRSRKSLGVSCPSGVRIPPPPLTKRGAAPQRSPCGPPRRLHDRGISPLKSTDVCGSPLGEADTGEQLANGPTRSAARSRRPVAAISTRPSASCPYRRASSLSRRNRRRSTRTYRASSSRGPRSSPPPPAASSHGSRRDLAYRVQGFGRIRTVEDDLAEAEAAPARHPKQLPHLLLWHALQQPPLHARHPPSARRHSQRRRGERQARRGFLASRA